MKKLRTALMTISSGMLLLLSCSKDPIPHNDQNKLIKTFSNTDFNRVQLSGNFKVTIRQGSDFSIKATGNEADLNDMKVVTEEFQWLAIGYRDMNRVHNDTVKVEITCPQLQIFNAGGTTKTTVSGFEQQLSYLQMNLMEAAEATVNGAPDELTFSTNGTSRLLATGTNSDLYGQLRGASNLDAYGLTTASTEVDAYGTSNARLTASRRLRLDAADASTIRYKGNPVNIFTEVRGTAQIIKE